jgi:hypothetical protein
VKAGVMNLKLNFLGVTVADFETHAGDISMRWQWVRRDALAKGTA